MVDPCDLETEHYVAENLVGFVVNDKATGEAECDVEVSAGAVYLVHLAAAVESAAFVCSADFAVVEDVAVPKCYCYYYYCC